MAEPHQVPALAPGRGGECPAQDRRARTRTRRQAQKDGRRVRQFFAPPPIYSLPTRTFPHCFWHFQWLFQPPETRLNSADVPIAVLFCNSDAKGGKKAKAGAKGSTKKDAQLAKGAKGKAKANKDEAGQKKAGKTKLGVSSDAAVVRAPESAAPKKRFKAAAAAAAVEEHKPPPDLDALERAMQAEARKIDELRRRRETAVSEVKDAERELLTVKTSVEDAEAVYNNVRSQPAGFHVDHHGHHDESHMNVDEGHDHHDDWDKFLDFGDGDDKTTGEPGAKSPARTGPRHSQGAGAHAAPRMSEGTDPVARAAAAAAAAEDVQSPAAAAAMRDATVAAVRVTASEPTHANHHRYQPSLHEAEQFLLQELKKLEAANARLMSARAHLEVIDRQLAAAIASAAERSEQRVAMMRRNPALVAGPVKKTWGGPPGARAKASVAEVVEEDDEDDEEEDGGTKKTTGRRNTAAAAGASAGGKVIEDRRFGIYDSRRYRMEGEPAPPDPSSDEDDEPRVGRGRGRGAKSGSAPKANAPKSVKSAKVTPVSADAVSIGVAGRGRGRGGAGVAGGRGRGRPPKNPRPLAAEPEAEIVSTKAGTNLKRHQGFQFRGQGGGASGFVAPSASDAATYIARAGTYGLQWRMKRPRTRSGVSRPASGPTSWAAMCSFALWKPAELKAAIARDNESAAQADATDEDSDDEDSSEGGGYESGPEEPVGSGHAHIDFDAFGYEVGDDGDMGMIMDMDFGEEFHPGLSP
jgi:hypothetical protein